jgi:hypothetical protein
VAQLETEKETGADELDVENSPTPTKRGRLAIILVVLVFGGYLSWDAYEPYWSFECKDKMVNGLHIDPLPPEGLRQGDPRHRFHKPPPAERCTFVPESNLRRLVEWLF